MKSKKGAFANSATGYSKKQYNSNHSKNTQKSSQKAADASSANKNNTTEETPKVKLDDVDTEWNSGFGAYLRSGEGVEMMKMFVFANTIMLIITMAWPHFKEQYIWLMQWLESFKEDY